MSEAITPERVPAPPRTSEVPPEAQHGTRVGEGRREPPTPLAPPLSGRPAVSDAGVNTAVEILDRLIGDNTKLDAGRPVPYKTLREIRAALSSPSGPPVDSATPQGWEAPLADALGPTPLPAPSGERPPTAEPIDYVFLSGRIRSVLAWNADDLDKCADKIVEEVRRNLGAPPALGSPPSANLAMRLRNMADGLDGGTISDPSAMLRELADEMAAAPPERAAVSEATCEGCDGVGGEDDSECPKECVMCRRKGKVDPRVNAFWRLLVDLRVHAGDAPLMPGFGEGLKREFQADAAFDKALSAYAAALSSRTSAAEKADV